MSESKWKLCFTDPKIVTLDADKDKAAMKRATATLLRYISEPEFKKQICAKFNERISVSYERSYDLRITVSPTSNCQIYSVGGLQYLIGYMVKKYRSCTDGISTVSEWHEEYCNLLLFLIAYFNSLAAEKNIMMLDINVAYANETYLKKLGITDECIILKEPYASTNGTKMCLLLINMRELLSSELYKEATDLVDYLCD